LSNRHSHRCPECGDAAYCYKRECILPQRIECLGCLLRRTRMHPAGLVKLYPAAPIPAPDASNRTEAQLALFGGVQ
jgi:hypothetical protein